MSKEDGVRNALSVIPAKAGIQIFCKVSKILDPPHCSAGDDEKRVFSTFYETINSER